MSAPLSHIVRRGALISAVVLAVVQVIAFAQTITLGRLLSPAEYGVYAAGTILTGFLATVNEGGLKEALIQRQAGNEHDSAVAVLWATTANGIVMSLLALAAAPVIGAIFHSTEVAVVAAASAGAVLLRTLTTVPDALLQRRLDFRRRMIVDPGVTLTFAVVSITLCALGFGVAGLVVATYVQQLVWNLLTWGLARWRPGWRRPSFALWRELARFGFPLALESLAERVREAAEGVLVGHQLDATALGNYRYGRRFSMLPATAVLEIASYVLLPVFSRIGNDLPRLRRAYLRALAGVWVAAVPVAGLLVALGEPAVVVLLGERWREAGVALMAMSGYGLGVAMNAVSFEAMKGAGQPNKLNWTTSLNVITGLGLLVLFAPFLGLVGVGLSVSVSSLVVGIVGLVLSRKVVGISGLLIAKAMAGPAIAGLVACVLLLWVDRAFIVADRHGLATGVALLVVETLAFGAVYLLSLRVFAPAAARSLAAGARALWVKRRQHRARSGDE